jgi:hypothetical protein
MTESNYDDSSGELQESILDAALKYAKRGLRVFPCRADNKAPLTQHGFQDATTDAKQIRSWWGRSPYALIGVPTGVKFSVLDLDTKKGKNGFEHVPDWESRSRVIARTRSGGGHLYFSADNSPGCTADEIALGVDTRGAGGYVIVPPSQGYTWIKGNLLDDLDRLPPWPDDMRPRCRDENRARGDEPEAHPEFVAAAVKVIPNSDLGWDEWNRTGMAIYAATDGSDAGYTIFEQFSQKSGKYRARTTAARWRHYHRSPPTQIGFGTLHHLATEADPDWCDAYDLELQRKLNSASTMSTDELCELLNIDLNASSEQEAPKQEAPKQKKTIIVPSAQFVGNFVPPDYLVDGLMQRRFVYSMTGLTGAGKTAIALRITAHVALGLALGAREVEQGKVLYFAGENPDDVRMRWIKLCEEMKIDPAMDAVFWREGRMSLTDSTSWMNLKKEAHDAGPFALVVIDTAAAYFEGKDENDNVQAGSYARTLRSLKEITGGPMVLVTTHPPKNAGPENLLPRGGGAFLNEMDGNFTVNKREKAADLHWLQKFRGPDFAPIPFLLTPGTTDKLKDSKGRLIWTVTAKPMSADEKAGHDAVAEGNEDRVLKLVVDRTGYSIADMARALGWLYSTGEPNTTRVFRALQALEKDRLVRNKGKRYEATKAGRERAGELPKDYETTEVPL